MFAIRRILCPTDHSEFSSRALAYAIPVMPPSFAIIAVAAAAYLAVFTGARLRRNVTRPPRRPAGQVPRAPWTATT